MSAAGTQTSDSPQRTGIGSSFRAIHVAPLVPLLLVAVAASAPIRDNSFLWHIRAGAVQLSDSRVITEDLFSFTMAGTPWRTQSWLIELLYGQLEARFDGLVWVNVMVGVLATTTAVLIGLSIYRGVRSPIVTGFAMIVTVWLAGPFIQPRPVIASYVLLAALVLVLQNRERMIWVVVPLLWLWAGVHGSWVIGGGLLILEWLRTSDPRIFKAGVAALGAAFLTAHGWGVWSILVDFANSQSALAMMDEWGVPDFADLAQLPYLIVIAGVIVAALRGKLGPRDLIVVLPFLFFGMTSKRAVFPAAIVVAPWAALAIPRIELPKSRSPAFVSGLAVAMILLLTLSIWLVRPLGELDYEVFPSQEIQEAMQGRNVFHDDVSGGFLIYDEWPGRLVFIDDRAELYGEDRIREMLEIRSGLYEEAFAEFGFDAALTKEKWGLTRRLDADGWIRVVEDAQTILFYRPEKG